MIISNKLVYTSCITKCRTTWRNLKKTPQSRSPTYDHISLFPVISKRNMVQTLRKPCSTPQLSFFSPQFTYFLSYNPFFNGYYLSPIFTLIRRLFMPSIFLTSDYLLKTFAVNFEKGLACLQTINFLMLFPQILSYDLFFTRSDTKVCGLLLCITFSILFSS